jgi:hypothetical protein
MRFDSVTPLGQTGTMIARRALASCRDSNSPAHREIITRAAKPSIAARTRTTAIPVAITFVQQHQFDSVLDAPDLGHPG